MAGGKCATSRHALISARYSPFIKAWKRAVEQDESDKPPIDSLAISYRYLKPLFAKVS